MGGSIGAAIGILIMQAQTGLSMADLTHYMGQYNNPEAMRHLAMYNNISQLFFFLLPALVFASLVAGGLRKGLWMYSPAATFVLFPLIVVGLSPLISMIEALNHLLIPAGSWLEQMALPQETELMNMTEGILRLEQSGGLFWTIASVIIFPSICEELAFRGVIQPAIGRITKNVHLAVWITALIFSFIHFQFYGFLPRLALGALFGYLVIWTGSIWTSVAAHALHNALAFMSFREQGKITTETSEAQDHTWILYFMIILGIAATSYMAQKSVFWKRRTAFLGLPDSTPQQE
ncbi:MAG: type II CAAX endopeptidase family protein [Flavobacteriales bacterium]|nr:type II CAAX endopeptidase family protein [Flavobacteriales bacterium]